MNKNYFFPKFMAERMAKMNLKLQLEATLMSTTLIMIGLALTTFYILVYVHTFPLWYKVVVIINCAAGFFFLGSSLITTFQQYQSYLNAVEFQKELKGGQNA